MFLTVRKKKSAAVIWAKIVIAWCAASCVIGIVHSYWQGRRMSVPAGLIRSDLQNQSPAVLSTATQKAKEPINWFLNTWMLLHTEHFSAPSVCSQQCLSCCGGHQICPLRCSPVETSLPVTAFTRSQFTGFDLWCRKRSKFKLRSDENAAWNHLVSFWLYIRAPKICKKKTRKKMLQR